MAIIPMRTVNALLLLSVDVEMPPQPRASYWFRDLRAAAVTELRALAVLVADVHLADADIAFEPIGRTGWRCHWQPARCRAELWGGPKDGLEVALPSSRDYVEFRQLAPGWRASFRPDADTAVRTVTLRYELAGFNPATRTTIYTYSE